MFFDIIFVDITCPQPYDAQTPNFKALGGTEASVVRIAEGLGKLGYKVAVLEHNLDIESMGYAYYLPMAYMSKIKARRLVSVRSVALFDLFPKAMKKYSWQHNEWTSIPNAKEIANTCIEYGAEIIAVSKWHEDNIRQASGNPDLKTRYIYNPCPDETYLEQPISYEKDAICWVASPHKGLARAAELFTELRKDLPKMELMVFNPGYLEAEGIIRPNGMIYVGSHPANTVWQQVAKSLAVFYPTSYEDTFGCIASEANALRTPIATNAVAALNETVSSPVQLSAPGDYSGVVSKIKDWYMNGKPNVKGQDRFRTSNVLRYWEKILNES